MYLYLIINSAKRALFMLNTWPQTLRPISVVDKNVYSCKKQCSTYNTILKNFCPFVIILKFFLSKQNAIVKYLSKKLETKE